MRAYRSAEVVEAAFDPARVRKELHSDESRGVIALLARKHVNEVVECGRYLYFGPLVPVNSHDLEEALRAADLCRGQISSVVE